MIGYEAWLDATTLAPEQSVPAAREDCAGVAYNVDARDVKLGGMFV